MLGWLWSRELTMQLGAREHATLVCFLRTPEPPVTRPFLGARISAAVLRTIEPSKPAVASQHHSGFFMVPLESLSKASRAAPAHETVANASAHRYRRRGVGEEDVQILVESQTPRPTDGWG